MIVTADLAIRYFNLEIEWGTAIVNTHALFPKLPWK